MKKYKPVGLQNMDAGLQGEGDDSYTAAVPVYLVSDVDVRIDQLEKALQSCVLALTKQRQAAGMWSALAELAIEESKQALQSLMEPGVGK